MSDLPTFLFATCRAGSEKSLKRHVLERYGKKFTPAFMRPQLITWKCLEPVNEYFELESVFARTSGFSAGKVTSLKELPEQVAKLGREIHHVQVYPREVPEDGITDSVWQLCRELEKSAGEVLNLHSKELKIGDGVLDIIIEPVAQPDIADNSTADSDHNPTGQPLFLGFHYHSRRCSPLPGGLTALTQPPEAPSRAWLKMEQALAWAGWDKEGFLQGKRVIDLGCAPGGATYSLLKRGAKVIGIDTGEMAPSLWQYVKRENAWFRHLKAAAGDLAFNELPDHADMIVCDINLPPPISLTYVDRIQQRVNAARMIITLKINDADVEAELPSSIGRLRSFAPTPLRTIQLPANRTEICVIAGE